MADKGGFDSPNIGHSAPADTQAIQELLKRGFSPEAILQLAQDGNLTRQAFQGVVNPSGGRFNAYSSGMRTGGLGQTREVLGGKLIEQTPLVGPGLLQAISGQKRGQDFAGQDRTPIKRQTLAPGQTKSDKAKGAGGTAVRLADALRKYSSITKGLRSGALEQMQQDQQGYGEAPPMPNASDFMPQSYSAPVLERRDFTQQANDMAASAYGPMYAALQQGKQNATGQYNTSDAVVKGLYDKLGAEIAASGAKQQQGYADAGTAAAQRYSELQKQIGSNYQAAADQEGQMLQAQGLQQAAGDTLPDDRAFAQNQAATTGAAQQDYFAKQGQAEGDYFAKLGVAGSTEGNVQRQNLVRELSNVLNQYDQQNLTLQGQQSQSAQDIAMRLSDQDFQTQQANAGLQADAFNANLGLSQVQNQIANQGYNNQYQQYRDQVGDSQFNRQQDAREREISGQMALAVAEQQGKSGGTGLEFNQLPAPQQVVAQADQLSGDGRGQDYYNLANDFMNGKNPDAYNTQTFSSAVAAEAARRGLNPAIALSIAASYWQRIMNRS
jgi:hypothetical protein